MVVVVVVGSDIGKVRWINKRHLAAENLDPPFKGIEEMGRN